MYKNKEDYEKNRIKDNTFLFGILNGTHLKELGDGIYHTEPQTHIHPDDYEKIFKNETSFRHISSGTNRNLGRLHWHGIDIFFKFSKDDLREIY